MKLTVVAALVAAILAAALPAAARIAGNKLAANGAAVQGFDQGALVVRAVTLADGTVITLN